jgi:predicted nucleic acid-binding protein
VILFDSSALIAHLRGDERATQLLLDTPTPDRLASVLTRVEIEGGMRSGERRSVSSLFGYVRLLAVTDPIARRAGEMLREHRRSHPGVDLVDYVIAATAELHGAQVATLNVKHCPTTQDLAAPF